jgi:anaerobic ribonucleoside-triphosphate reductase
MRVILISSTKDGSSTNLFSLQPNKNTRKLKKKMEMMEMMKIGQILLEELVAQKYHEKGDIDLHNLKMILLNTLACCSFIRFGSRFFIYIIFIDHGNRDNRQKKMLKMQY